MRLAPAAASSPSFSPPMPIMPSKKFTSGGGDKSGNKDADEPVPTSPHFYNPSSKFTSLHQKYNMSSMYKEGPNGQFVPAEHPELTKKLGSAPPTVRRSFFSKLFGKKPKTLIADDDGLGLQALADEQAPLRKGFFSKIFSFFFRKKKKKIADDIESFRGSEGDGLELPKGPSDRRLHKDVGGERKFVPKAAFDDENPDDFFEHHFENEAEISPMHNDLDALMKPVSPVGTKLRVPESPLDRNVVAISFVGQGNELDEVAPPRSPAMRSPVAGYVPPNNFPSVQPMQPPVSPPRIPKVSKHPETSPLPPARNKKQPRVSGNSAATPRVSSNSANGVHGSSLSMSKVSRESGNSDLRMPLVTQEIPRSPSPPKRGTRNTDSKKTSGVATADDMNFLRSKTFKKGSVLKQADRNVLASPSQRIKLEQPKKDSVGSESDLMSVLSSAKKKEEKVRNGSFSSFEEIKIRKGN